MDALDSEETQLLNAERNRKLEGVFGRKAVAEPGINFLPEPGNAIRPVHYGGEVNPHEPIKVIEHYELGFNLGNTIKYILRAGKKDANKEIEDLEKAAWYLNRQIENLKKQREVEVKKAVNETPFPDLNSVL